MWNPCGGCSWLDLIPWLSVLSGSRTCPSWSLGILWPYTLPKLFGVLSNLGCLEVCWPLQTKQLMLGSHSTLTCCPVVLFVLGEGEFLFHVDVCPAALSESQKHRGDGCGRDLKAHAPPAMAGSLPPEQGYKNCVYIGYILCMYCVYCCFPIVPGR